ncbi:hypothetical protein DPMN_103133 [Dreissena polymorpha]|uniref:Uncharacterized protein n=1 Tax=Dreissena polymorpha TaxID=45954 RepID=A0A9D4H7X1_DREPO|nr:hypothetical protein DPMN_103133 [Dreissena polymorpha]
MTKFYEDQAVTVTSRVKNEANVDAAQRTTDDGQKAITKAHHEHVCSELTRFHYSHLRKNVPHPGGHFHENWTKHVNEKMPRPLAGSHVFQGFVRTYVFTKFHEIRKTATQPCSHVFQPTGTIFELFYEDWTINVASRVFDEEVEVAFQEDWTKNVTFRVLARKNALPPGGNFHEDWTINVTSIVSIKKTAPPPGAHVFQPIGTIFELIKDITWTVDTLLISKNILPPDIIRTNVLTKFHEDWTVNVTSRVLTRKNTPNSGSHVFLPAITIFELFQGIIRQTRKMLTTDDEQWKKGDHKSSP